MIVSHLRSNAVAYLALAVALGTGTAYAADQVANGSVTTKKLAKNAVTSPKIKKNAVRSADIKDGTVRAADLQAGLLPEGLAISGEFEGGMPAAAPESPSNRTHVFTSSGGRTYIDFTYNTVGVTCSAGTAYMGLYLDGSPVPGTRYRLPASGGGAEEALGLGAVVVVAPGSHTASIGLDCPTGNLTSGTHTDSRWFVLTPKG